MQKLITDTWKMTIKMKIKDTFQFDEDFIKNYYGESDERYFLEADVQNPEKLHGLHNVLPFLPEKMKIGQSEKLKTNLHDLKECIIHTKT